MFQQNLIRVVAAALALSTLSFAAGVAGDLSIIDPPRSGERVVLRIPPEIPANAVRAAPLPPLLSTASAHAAPARIQSVAYVEEVEAPLEELAGAPELPVVANRKPQHELTHSGPKPSVAVATKGDDVKSA